MFNDLFELSDAASNKCKDLRLYIDGRKKVDSIVACKIFSKKIKRIIKK